MKLSDFNYNLPKGLIAKYPIQDQAKCRLMVLDRKKRSISHKTFEDIYNYIERDDCLVLNDTKVIPARLFGKRKSGGKVEIFLLEKRSPVCEVLIRPSSRLRDGEVITLESGDNVEILKRGEIGRFVRFNNPIDDILKKAGHMPLPPYIDRDDEDSDKDSYQTVYAAEEGATASPSAGLHFTKELLCRIQRKGVKIAYLTLHINYATFAPIKCEDINKHRMYKEYFSFPQTSRGLISSTKRTGYRVFAVGTTTARVLEHWAINGSNNSSGYTNLFIYPGYEFKTIDCLVTNFHLPMSTLLCLVSAFAGREFVLGAYQRAIEMHYRFYSYGDAMLII